MKDKIQRLANMIQAQARSERGADSYVCKIKPGRKYTALLVGPANNLSYRYFVDTTTGDIYGNAGPSVDRRRYYGTLDSVDSYYWGGYAAVKMGPTFPESLRPDPADYDASPAPIEPEFVHTLTAGDILYSSYGYDQTNIDFYQVIATTKKTVTFRELKQIARRDTTYGDGGTTVPDVGNFADSKEHARTVKPGNCVNFAEHEGGYMLRLNPWDGRPMSWSDGH